MSFFAVEGLTVGYGGARVLQGISFSVERGMVTGLLGVNGCGKTTLVKAICGQIPHEGVCTLEGQRLESLPPRALARCCAYLPQRGSITIDISALDVVLMSFNPCLGLLEQPDRRMWEHACRALEQAGLKGREHDNYLALSEGQKQMCLLARTLVSSAKLMLLDEPEGGLDLSHRSRLFHLLRRWTKQGDRAVLAALHDPDLALNCCDRLLLLNGEDAAVLNPRADTLPVMEETLSRFYGAVELVRCPSRSGREHLVMLKDEEAGLWDR